MQQAELCMFQAEEFLEEVWNNLLSETPSAIFKDETRNG